MDETGEAMRLLVADDDADTRQSMRLLLERAGHEVELAADGAKALEAQRSRACDVLVTDIFMGESDGIDAIRNFRREFPKVRIVAMSGGRGSIRGGSYLTTAGIIGADATLLKPFDVRQLLDMLQAFERH
jgi:CheY-like chemotaxis protein